MNQYYCNSYNMGGKSSCVEYLHLTQTAVLHAKSEPITSECAQQELKNIYFLKNTSRVT